jgi:hypothetical protein
MREAEEASDIEGRSYQKGLNIQWNLDLAENTIEIKRGL